MDDVNNLLINAKQLSRCKQISLVTIKSVSSHLNGPLITTDNQINQVLEENFMLYIRII